MNIILPIKKEYSDKILSGEKRYEFRKSIPKTLFTHILIYESRGVGKVVGEVKVDRIITDSPDKVYELTKEYAGISKEDFLKYFENCDKAYAYVLKNPIRFDEPHDLSEYGITAAPQNFIYVKNDNLTVCQERFVNFLKKHDFYEQWIASYNLDNELYEDDIPLSEFFAKCEPRVWLYAGPGETCAYILDRGKEITNEFIDKQENWRRENLSRWMDLDQKWMNLELFKEKE